MNLPLELSRGRVRTALITILVLGIVVRGVAVWLAPMRSYVPDHLDNMAWSDYAFTHGPHRIYEFAELTPYLVRYRADDGSAADSIMLVPHACNYPPLSAYVFWLQGALWHAVDSDVRTVNAPPGLPFSSVSTRTLDTLTARAVQAVPACLFDIPLALGVAAIVAALRGASRWGGREIAAFTVTLLAPPVFLNSAFWGQADSWITCWLVWVVHALLRRQFVVGGLLLGAALMTKPQAILLAPVLAWWLASLRWGEGGSWARVASAWKFVAATVVAVGVITAPFMLADRDHADGPLRWFERSYAATIGAEDYERTTLNAFNVWWLEWMARGATPDGLASDAPLLGTTKKRVGLGLLALGVAVSVLVVAWRHRFSGPALVALTALTLLAAFLLPTEVHERYIYYCVPFFGMLAVMSPWRWGWPLVVLVIVATGEMTAFLWVGRAESAAVRGVTTAMAAAALLCLVYAWTAIAASRRAGGGMQPL